MTIKQILSVLLLSAGIFNASAMKTIGETKGFKTFKNMIRSLREKEPFASKALEFLGPHMETLDQEAEEASEQVALLEIDKMPLFYVQYWTLDPVFKGMAQDIIRKIGFEGYVDFLKKAFSRICHPMKPQFFYYSLPEFFLSYAVTDWEQYRTIVPIIASHGIEPDVIRDCMEEGEDEFLPFLLFLSNRPFVSDYIKWGYHRIVDLHDLHINNDHCTYHENSEKVVDDYIKQRCKGDKLHLSMRDDQTILMYMSLFGQSKLVKRILDYKLPGYFINARDAHGFTALEYAARRGHLSIASWLLQAGAYPTYKALLSAAKHNHHSIAVMVLFALLNKEALFR